MFRRLLAAALACVAVLAACAPASLTVAEVPEPAGVATARYLGRPEDRFLDVLTYNAALLPAAVSSTRPAERVALMAPYLKGYDVLVLQEVFVDEWRERLLTELADAYPYRGELVGRDGAGGFPFTEDGGIVILSRWPVVRQATMTFGPTCSGTDCLADKGVAYVAVRKGERTFHVFGTHAQSVYGFDPAAVRAAQFELFAGFVAGQDIPEDEPVLLAGDFNVNAYSPELESMLRTLGASWPPLLGTVRATWDPGSNVWADGPTEWLDYVLVADGYAVPAAAWNRALPLRVAGMDLSDHHAVWARVALAR